MANAATNLLRELFTRIPTKSNEIAADMSTALQNARYKHRCAVTKFAQTVEQVLSEKDSYPSES